MGIGAKLFDYKKLLTTPLKKSALVNDLAEACNEVLGKEVEERRRKLERSRDSVVNRKGQIVSWFDYLPEKGNLAYDASTNEPVDIPVGSTIPKARVLQLVSNIGIYGQESAVDYLKVEFEDNKGRTIQWNMPMSAPQERSLLISNAYMLGFDFYSTTLSNEDYQRLYEFLNMFWPENGIDDNFIKFIGFIKNLKLELAPLWSEDNGTDTIKILEELNETRTKVTEGGTWYLTSHVAINYDLKQQNSIYPINFDEIERLFYLFAPIMLVLERIVGNLDVFIEMGQASVPIADVTNYGISERDPNILITNYRLVVSNIDVINYGLYADSTYENDPDNDLGEGNSNTIEELDLYIPENLLAFSLNIQNFDTYDTSKFQLDVKDTSNTNIISAYLANNLLYTGSNKLIVYIPSTDLDISNIAKLTYSLKYRFGSNNSYTELLKGELIKFNNDDVAQLDIQLLDDIVSFSISPATMGYSISDYQYTMNIKDSNNKILITADEGNGLLYRNNGTIIIYIDKSDFDISNISELNYILYHKLINNNAFKVACIGTIHKKQL